MFQNGNFESGSHNTPPPSWTVTPGLNPGVTVQNPQTREGLNIQSGGSGRTYTYLTAAGPETQTDPGLGAGASLRWPKYGNGVAVVNFQGTGRSVNSLRQTMTVTSADIDPTDGKAHVRFTVAPVLQEPGHTPSQQPYYFVQLRNITKNQILYRDYNASAQPGVPWKVSNGLYYTDWQLVDIAPGSASLAIGDSVELEVIAAGCSLNGHYGHVYVDGIGSTVPGLFVSATGPSAANAGSPITYTLTYSNGGTVDANDVVVNLATPASTTFQAVSTSVGSCTAPSVGGTGTVSCQLGTLQPGASRSFTITVGINAGASGTITNGNYSIAATGSTPLLGPKVYTTVTSGVTYADLAITKTNGVGGVGWGQPVTYTIVASNAGPNAVTGATVTDVIPSSLTGATWTCAGSGGGTCAASGSGNISDASVALPVGGTVTYTLSGNVIGGSGSGTLANTASIALPVGATDPDPTNNAAGDTDPIGDLYSVTVVKAGTGQGTIVSAPASITCGPSCESAIGQFVDGDTVVLSANPEPEHTFVGWSGACSGTGTCTIQVTAAANVTATFTAPLAADGQICGNGAECLSGHCVDGLCCDAACDGDCQACDLAGSEGVCSPLAQGTTCRAAAGDCDVAESCDGISGTCPADSFVSAGVECRASGGDCDLPESCTGTSAACPPDVLVSAGTECRAAAGDCDLPEACDGSSAACPADAVASAGTMCRAAAGDCDVPESCDGASVACPADLLVSAGTLCRTAAGDCDLPEACTGASAVCPADLLVAAGTECRAAAGDCDVAESCTGASTTCPADAFVTAGTECRPAAGICDVAEACTGAGASCPGDAFVAAGTECRAASCAGSTATLAASCSGGGATCPDEQLISCGPYQCGAEACMVSCFDKSDCTAGHHCDVGSCVPDLVDGVECNEAVQCASGSCVDGVCCDSSCTGQCEACDVAGSVGTCSPVNGAPHGERPACDGDGSACDGFCDGSATAACSYPDAAVTCRDAACSNGVATLEATCNGTGSCPAEETQSCGAFACGATACIGDCQSHGDCAAGNYCSAGVCMPERALGVACSEAFQCASGNCADGVCCDSGCTGQCEACAEVGSEGTCTPVSGAPRGARPDCASDDSLCGGSCDGIDATSCAYPDDAVLCRAPTCADAIAVIPAYCDGAGACPAEQTQTCTPFQCGATACLGDCNVDADCATTHYCSAGVCLEKLDYGVACAADNVCESGLCVDGVCCDGACTGQCEACDVAGSEGTCSAVVGAPHGSRTPCASDGSLCGGACDGATVEACAYPGAELGCREAACEAGVATMAAACDGQGACPDLVEVACGEYACGADACQGDCLTGDDCADGYFCAAGICLEERPLGEACGGAAECASGHCVDGLCCDRACDGQCEACDATPGTCEAISGSPHGGRAPCGGTGACAGSCDGADPLACQFPGADTSCRDATCAGGIATPASACDGAGTCNVPASSHCEEGCDGAVCAEALPPSPTDEIIPRAAGGCACSAAPGTRDSAWMVALGGVALALGRRRRRSIQATR